MGSVPQEVSAIAIGDDCGTAEPAAFRNGMARLGAAVNIVTSDGPAGRAGFTASAVCSVTDTPPTLLVCVNRGSSVYEIFAENGAVCVNTLAPAHVELSRLFGGKTPSDERFAAGTWRPGRSGAPVLEGALVAFDCRVHSIVQVDTHNVMFCRVLDVAGENDDEALLYLGRKYHALSI